MRILSEDVSTLSQDQFRALRRGKVTGSIVSAAIGSNPYLTPRKVVCEWLGLTPPSETNRAMRLGTKRERDVAQEFEIETGIKTKPVNQIWQHDHMDWAVVTPDFWAESKLLETKTTKASNFWRYEMDAPEYVKDQLTWQLGIGGVKKGYVACLSGDNEFVYHEINFDDSRFNKLVEAGDRLRWFFEKGELPPPTDLDLGLVRSLAPDPTEKRKDLTPIRSLVENYNNIQAKLNHCKKELDAIKAQLLVQMGDAGIGEIEGKIRVRVTKYWKSDYMVKGHHETKLTIK